MEEPMFFVPRCLLLNRRNTEKDRIRRFWFTTLLLLMMALAFPAGASAQGNYVYINNQTASNSVVAYSVSPAGALTAVPGSPFSTHGAGANVLCYALDRMTISAPGNLLYVANTGDMTI